MNSEDKLKGLIGKILKLEFDNEKSRIFTDETMITKIKKWIEEETHETQEN